MKRILLLCFVSLFMQIKAQYNTSQCMDTLYHFTSYNASIKGAVITDWTHDGLNDILVASPTNNSIDMWYRTIAGKQFPNQTPIISLPQARNLQKGFFNGDGYEDIAVLITNSGNDSIVILCSDGAGGILSRNEFSSPYYQAFYVQDMNQDGLDDIIGYDFLDYRTIHVHMNQSGISFYSPQDFFVAQSNIKELNFGDFDNNGTMDIYVGSQFINGVDSSQIMMIKNSTPPSQLNPVVLNEQYRFTFAPGINKGLTEIAVGDFNNDGFSDVAASLTVSSEIATLFSHNGDSLDAPTFDVSLNFPTTLEAMDIDGDLDIDLVSRRNPQHLLYSRNDGTGHIVAVTENDLGSNAIDFFTGGNLDGNNLTDFVVFSTNNGLAAPKIIYNKNDFSVKVIALDGNAICSGVSARFIVTNTDTSYFNYAGFSPYSWSNSINNDTSLYSATNSFIYVQAVNTLNGCTRLDTSYLIVNLTPNVNLGADYNGCYNFGVSIGTPPENNVSYSWSSNPSGFSSNNNYENVSPYGTPTEYYLSGIDTTSGCSANDSINVTIFMGPTPNLGSDRNICGGTVLLQTGAQPNVTYYWTSTPPGYTGLGDSIVVSPTTPIYYTIHATDTITGCTGKDSANVVVHPMPYFVGLGQTVNLCAGDTIQLGDFVQVVGGTAPYNFDWWNGPSHFYTVNPTYIPTMSLTFTISVSDANGCSPNAGPLFVPYTNTAGTDLIGHVTTPLPADVDNGYVYAFKHHPGSAGLDTIDIVPLQPLGQYDFVGLDNGDYLIKVIANPTAFPLAVPTYYGNAFQWDSSLVMTHGCVQTDTADIQVLETSTATGPGFISGYIIEGYGYGSGVRIGHNGHNDIPFAPGGPLKGIDVKLGKNPGGGIQSRVMTDSTGYYEFDSLPLHSYKIYVDIPNLPMDSTREITLVSGSETSAENNYYADSASIYVLDSAVAVGIYATSKEYENKFTVFPNPSKDYISLHFTIGIEKSYASIEITNTIGTIVYKTIKQSYLNGDNTISVNAKDIGLNAGAYFVSIILDGRKYTQRIIIVD